MLFGNKLMGHFFTLGQVISTIRGGGLNQPVRVPGRGCVRKGIDHVHIFSLGSWKSIPKVGRREMGPHISGGQDFPNYRVATHEKR